MGILLNYTNVLEPAHQFISSMGRMKYLTPVYQALLKTNQKALAIQWYEENVDFYHPYAVLQIGKLLGVISSEEP
jgi:leukotriene-A4 hydrolase